MEKLKIVDVPINKIKPYERNPRRNEDTVAKLVDLIRRVGFNQPLLLDKGNNIVKGHARYEACKRLGFKTIPCVYTDNSEDLVKFDRIADNKVHELTTWDADELLHEVDMLNTDYDMLSLGVVSDKYYDFVDQSMMVDGIEEDDEESLEAKRERYLKLLEEIENTPVEIPVFTTQSDVDKAREKQDEVSARKRQLKAITCKGCGKTLYVDVTKIYDLWVEE